jgi:hypothetical protein
MRKRGDKIMEEFVIEWLKGQDRAAISAPSGSAMKNKLLKLAKDHPSECDYFENPDGYALGHVPVKYIKINPPRTVSEETKEKLAERVHNIRNKNGQKSF